METYQNGVLNLYKHQGETPLDAIKRFRAKHSEYENIKMTYAGRLDPMAEGVLIVLCGEAVYRKENYLLLDKVYEFDLIFGLETDTYDMLGKITYYKPTVSNITSPQIESSLKNFMGRKKQKYPAYSSKTVQGKQLFTWAREGKIHEIDIPVREIEIYRIELKGSHIVEKEEFEQMIFSSISKMKGDFRQAEIIDKWREYFRLSERQEFTVFTCEVVCSSGTYVRAIAHEIGSLLKEGAIVSKILRKKVGEFSLENAIK